MKDPYQGFVPDRKPRYVIQGTGLLFFLTSCALALVIFPTLFATHAFEKAQELPYANPEPEYVEEIVGIAATHLGWTLAPFIVAGYVFRFRRMSIAYAAILIALGIWLFETLPLSTAGDALLVGSWSLATAFLIMYRKELD